MEEIWEQCLDVFGVKDEINDGYRWVGKEEKRYLEKQQILFW